MAIGTVCTSLQYAGELIDPWAFFNLLAACLVCLINKVNPALVCVLSYWVTPSPFLNKKPVKHVSRCHLPTYLPGSEANSSTAKELEHYRFSSIVGLFLAAHFIILFILCKDSRQYYANLHNHIYTAARENPDWSEYVRYCWISARLGQYFMNDTQRTRNAHGALQSFSARKRETDWWEKDYITAQTQAVTGTNLPLRPSTTLKLTINH